MAASVGSSLRAHSYREIIVCKPLFFILFRVALNFTTPKAPTEMCLGSRGLKRECSKRCSIKSHKAAVLTCFWYVFADR